jgi:hypothetical protein
MGYRYWEKRKTLAVGVYRAVSLVKTRKRSDEARGEIDSAHPRQADLRGCVPIGGGSWLGRVKLGIIAPI